MSVSGELCNDAKAPPPPKCGELLLLGDLQLGRQVDRMLTIEPGQRREIWGDLPQSLLRPPEAQNRLVCANLECAVTGTSDPDQALERRDVHFRLDPPNMGVLTEGHIDYVNLANDHTRDFRTTGLRDTMTHLEALGIAHTGAGRKSKAGRGIVIQRGDVKYGFMSFSDHPREWAAFDKVYGINYINSKTCDPAEVCSPITQFKKESLVDVMVVSVHWGSMWASGNPPENIQALFHAMADAGADVVHGHGSHNLRGVELYNRKIIIYGAGTCIDDYFPDEDKRNDLSCGYLVYVENGAVSYMEMHALKITQRLTNSTTGRLPQVMMAHGADREKVMSRLTAYSKAIDTTVYTKKKVLVLYVNPDLKPIKSQASFIQISRRVSANLTIGQSASRLTAQLRSLTSSPMHRRTRSTPSANWQNASLVGQLSNDGSSAPGEGAGGGSSTPTSPQQPQQQGGALQATKSPHASKWSMPALSLPSARKLLFKNGSTPPMEDDS